VIVVASLVALSAGSIRRLTVGVPADQPAPALDPA